MGCNEIEIDKKSVVAWETCLGNMTLLVRLSHQEYTLDGESLTMYEI